MNLPSATETI